ncbi:MAG: glycosyltransferase family 2 protein [Butyrivibrio sp.]|nr:glycosyltransferase family 2 protein [Butyrivibrio sp.]MBP3196044.1 glycosyltransferase family 2 protein [Butyrivibrio sp.]
MITASIVLYNTTADQLATVVKSYEPSENRRLFLIDNNKEKNELYAKVASNAYISYIHNEKNFGYGSAHNIGIKSAILTKSDYHIVLNPDLEFKPEIIDSLVEYADKHKDVVYMLPKVVYPNGETQYLCKLLPTPADLIFRRFLPPVGIIKKMNDRYILKDTSYNHIMNPPCLSGCFMFMRTSALAENQLFFDERFFMYCEDFDLMRRLHRVGKTIYYPFVKITHMHEKSSYKNLGMLMMHIKSACKYFNKYGWFIDHERRCFNDEIKKNELKRG